MDRSTRHVLIALAAAALALPAIAADAPRPAPEVAIRMPDGTQKLLSQYKGKVVALEFLYTTCPHCQATAELMNRLYKEYGPKGFQPLGAAFNDGAEQLVPKFIADLHVTYPVGSVARDTPFSFMQLSPMIRTTVPFLAIIDRTGAIRAEYTGSDPFFTDQETNMRNVLQPLLNEPAAKRRPAHKTTR